MTSKDEDANKGEVYGDTDGYMSLLASMAPDKGSSLIGIKRPESESIPRSVRDKLLDAVSTKDFGVTGDGSTDDTVAMQAAIDSGAGSIQVMGNVVVTDTIQLQSNQFIYLGPGNSMSWDGATGGTMFESPSDSIYVRAGVLCDGGFIDLNGCAVGISLHSYQYCIFDWESTDETVNSTLTVVKAIADSTSDDGSVTGTKNTTNNYWRRLFHHNVCGTLLKMAGTGDSGGHLIAGHTLNSFGKIRSGVSCADYGIDIGPWCDTNNFYDMVSLNCGDGATAINLRDFATVYCITFNHVNVAMYGSASSRRAVYIGNQVRWLSMEHLFVDSSNTAEVDAGAIVDGGALSYRINLYRETGTYASKIETRSKQSSVLAGNFAFGESFHLASGSATSVDHIPPMGCIVAYNSSNGDFTGLCYVRASSSPSCASIAGNTTYIVFTTGALVDGGGTNSRLTISAGNDGKLYLSNRLSQGLNLSLTCLSGLY